MQTRSKSPYLLLSGYIYLFFFICAAVMSLFSLWLGQTLALGRGQIGVIFSVNALAAICLQPLYGYVQDKLDARQGLLWWVAGLLLLIGPFLVYVYGPLLRTHLLTGAIIGAIYFSAAIFAGMGVMESYVERQGRALGYEFGRLRMWGSLGWASATFCAGILINIDPELNFWLASAAAGILLLMLPLLRTLPRGNVPTSGQAPVRLADAMALLRLSRFWLFTLFILGTFSVSLVADQQFPIYFASLFEDIAVGNRMYGYLNALQVVLEAIAMFIAPGLVNRLGVKNSLLLAGGLIAARLMAFGLVEGPAVMAAVRLCQALDLALILVSVFKYLAKHFDNRLASTLYLLGFQVCIQIGGSVYSPIAGQLYETIGFPRTFQLMGLLAFGITLLSARTLVTDRWTEGQVAVELPR